MLIAKPPLVDGAVQAMRADASCGVAVMLAGAEEVVNGRAEVVANVPVPAVLTAAIR